MLFNSAAFAVFLPAAFVLYWVFPAKYRWAVLLGLSWVFYLWFDPRFGLVLGAATAVSFGTGLLLGRAGTTRQKKGVLAAGVVALAGMLAVFKYTGFAVQTLNAVRARTGAGQALSVPAILLPVGISFYTFQTIGYLIDVYRGKIAPERHFGYYALFVSFFPAVTSGPIGRAGGLLPQYRKARTFDSTDVSRGLKELAWGYFLKLCIADRLAPIVDRVYGNYTDYAGFIFVVVPFLYSIEIYCDFAGYSAIAIGVARLFGIRLDENFRSPYLSTSVREFWGRWHKSLSSWLRDYLYIPLGGSRCSRLRHGLNLMVTFLVSGIWHGAGWTFLLWGAIHGAFQCVEALFRPSHEKRQATRTSAAAKKQSAPLRLLKILWTFLLVTFAWMFFRADSVETVWYFFRHAFDGIGSLSAYRLAFHIALGVDVPTGIFMLLPIALMLLADIRGRDRDLVTETARWNPRVKYPLYILFVLMILLFAEKGVATNFIYAGF